MGKINDVVKIANMVARALPANAKKAGDTLGSISHTEDDLRRQLKRMSDAELVATYVPDVYQKDIYSIEYEKLKEHGIKLISFDIDDTIAPLGVEAPPDTVKLLFRDLRMLGITVVLLTNNTDEKGKKFAEELGVDYIAGAKKPYSIGFQAVLSDYEERYHEKLEKSEMAHVGNHLTKDIKGGNIFGVTTCLVRRVGKWGHVGAKMQKLVGVNESHIVREELKGRGIWYRHHQYEKGDQYYQLGEDPGYKQSGKPDADIVKEAVDDLMRQWNADKDKSLNLAEFKRDSYRKKESLAVQSLRAQFGDDIILTGAWDEEEDMHELEESELLEGEMSAFVYKVGNYMVRQAGCLYQDGDGVYYTERKPAGKDAIAAYTEARHSYICEPPLPYRRAKKISAKYIGGGSVLSEEWQSVCFEDQAKSCSWYESINFICAVKGGKMSPDSREALYVLKSWVGDSSSYDYWYRFTPDGAVEEYRIYPLDNPFEIEACKEKWELAGKS